MLILDSYVQLVECKWSEELLINTNILMSFIFLFYSEEPFYYTLYYSLYIESPYYITH